MTSIVVPLFKYFFCEPEEKTNEIEEPKEEGQREILLFSPTKKSATIKILAPFQSFIEAQQQFAELLGVKRVIPKEVNVEKGMIAWYDEKKRGQQHKLFGKKVYGDTLVTMRDPQTMSYQTVGPELIDELNTIHQPYQNSPSPRRRSTRLRNKRKR